jgi:hypothetical protein
MALRAVIDKEPKFLYVPSARVLSVDKETGAILYDIPGVELTHVGNKCSFDTCARDLALQRM